MRTLSAVTSIGLSLGGYDDLQNCVLVMKYVACCVFLVCFRRPGVLSRSHKTCVLCSQPWSPCRHRGDNTRCSLSQVLSLYCHFVSVWCVCVRVCVCQCGVCVCVCVYCHFVSVWCVRACVCAFIATLCQCGVCMCACVCMCTVHMSACSPTLVCEHRLNASQLHSPLGGGNAGQDLQTGA